MNRIALNRRRFLTAIGATALTYPFIRSLPSYAATGDAPTYLILLFTPCGFVQHLWGAQCPAPTSATTPTKQSPLVFRDTLAPLEPIKDKVIVLEGLNVASASGSHEPGMGALWTGVKTSNEGLGPSIDQVIAKQLNAGRPFNSIELMVRSSVDWTGREVKTRMIYTGPSAYADPFDDPVAARAALFPNVPTGSGSMGGGAPDKKTFIRGKLFNQLNTELTGLQSKLCNEDKQQLQKMQDAWNDLSGQLSQAATAAQSCAAPAAAPAGYMSPSVDFPTSCKLQMDILAMALACDLTRVASLQFSTATSQVTHTWLGSDQKKVHHDYSHDGPTSMYQLGPDPYSASAASAYPNLSQLAAIDKFYAQQVYYLANALSQYSAGGKNLLDQSVICWGSEIDIGAAHNHNNTPFVLIGGGGGKLATNQVVRFPMKIDADQTTSSYMDRAHNDLLLTLANVMGLNMTTFGDAGLCSGPIKEILAT